jgi:hypothetical protein
MKLNLYNPEFSLRNPVVCRYVWIAIVSNFVYGMATLCNYGCHLHRVIRDNIDIRSLTSSHNTLITLTSLCKESCVYCAVIFILLLCVVSRRICKFTECHHLGIDIL